MMVMSITGCLSNMQDHVHHDGIGRPTRYSAFAVHDVEVDVQDNITECGVHMLAHFDTIVNASVTAKLQDKECYLTCDAIQSEKDGMRSRVAALVDEFKVISPSSDSGQ